MTRNLPWLTGEPTKRGYSQVVTVGCGGACMPSSTSTMEDKKGGKRKACWNSSSLLGCSLHV